MIRWDFRNGGDDVLITTFENFPTVVSKLRALAMKQLRFRRQIATIRRDQAGRHLFERFAKKKKK
jgi:hypothetical protein